jgi:Flp pilus assembly pilin Flp
MAKFIANTKAFLEGEAGTTTVEYAVMLVLIAGACIAAITTLGGENGIVWGNNSTEINSVLE